MVFFLLIKEFAISHLFFYEESVIDIYENGQFGKLENIGSLGKFVFAQSDFVFKTIFCHFLTRDLRNFEINFKYSFRGINCNSVLEGH